MIYVESKRSKRIYISHYTGLPQKITSALEEYNKSLDKKVAVIITASDYSHDSFVENEVQIIAYPEGVIYNMSADCDFTVFMRGIFSSIDENAPIVNDDVIIDRPNSITNNGIDGSSIDGISDDANIVCSLNDDDRKQHNFLQMARVIPVIWRKLILVCVHNSRDKRCGRAGPQVIDELNEQLLSRSIVDITVAGSSHIGGHKFAGR